MSASVIGATVPVSMVFGTIHAHHEADGIKNRAEKL